VLTATAAQAAVTTLYVGQTNCSDSGSGTQAQPYCTIGKGVATAVAGQTVLVGAGTYSEKVTLPRSGTAGSPITVKSDGVGAATVTGGVDGFVLSTRSYVIIDGFTVTGTSGVGIKVTGGSNVTLSNDTVTHSGLPVSGSNAHGISLSGVTNSLVTGVHSDHNSFHGIIVTGGSTGVVLQGNEASFNAEGWQRNANGIDIVAAGNSAIGNIVHDNEDSGLQFYTGGDNGLAVDNVSYGNGDHGIDDLNVTGGELIGNTVYDNCTDGINIEGTSGNYTVENNISTDNAINTACAHGPAGADHAGRGGDIGFYDSATSGSVEDYNVVSLSTSGKLYEWGASGYTTLAAFQTASGQGAHDVQANPLFTNAAAGDFTLQAGSPAIDSADSGVANWPSTDIAGNGRVDDPAVSNTGAGSRTYDDRGAYERQ
jgi:hypothetical protein